MFLQSLVALSLETSITVFLLIVFTSSFGFIQNCDCNPVINLYILMMFKEQII